ncbi:MAG: MopE-related protein, partial [Myxococcota bacterium]|nr:MopE-related protein [Myxococcota bacterium]
AACEDCDDTDETRSPSATEVCDEIDNNCNGVVDIDATEVPSWYLDYDGDGFGDATVSVDQCEPPARFVDNANDCDDSSALALPGGIEVCDNLDNDCDGEVDGQDSEGAQAFYTDSDGDGYGVDSTQVFICFPDSDQVADPGDCDDTNEAVSPGAEEVCNDGIDNDCDGTSEGCEVEAEELSDVILRGEASQDYAGRSITGVGDLNNDGIDDVVVGADGYANEGAAYVIYGPLTGGTDTTLDVVSHLVVEGSSSAGSAGERALGLGDIDGDGLDDMLIAAPTATDRATRSGTVHLFLGSTIAAQTSGTALSIDNSDFQWNGNDPYDWAGEGLANLGDWDADGISDFAIGATGDEVGGAGSGTIYVITGTGAAPTGSSASVTDVAELSIAGNGSWYIGANIDGVGDFDGDGSDDLGVGVIQANANGNLSGAAFLVGGGQAGSISIDDADLRLNGTGANDRAGAGMGAAGDVNGDGYPDMLVGVSRDDAGAADAGAIVLVHGRTDLTTLDGADIQVSADATVTGPGASIGIGES